MKQNSQQGSAHVVVVVCLVIALIFALSWIFWQNFVHEEPVKKDTELVVVKPKTSSNTQKQPSGSTGTVGERVLQIPEYKIKITIPATYPALTYKIDKSSGDNDLLLFVGGKIGSGSCQDSSTGFFAALIKNSEQRLRDLGDTDEEIAQYNTKVGADYWSLGFTRVCTDKAANDFFAAVRKGISAA